MTHYKSFQDIGRFNNNPYPPSQPMGGCSGGSCGHSAGQATPPGRMSITELPPLQNLETYGQQGVGRHPGITPNAFTRGGNFDPSNIKTIARNLQEERNPQQQFQGPILEPLHTAIPMMGMAGEDVGCKAFSNHVDNCKRCYKLYRRNHKQGALIIFLVFIIILLIIRLMDKADR